MVHGHIDGTIEAKDQVVEGFSVRGLADFTAQIG
jgi:hypothetical protein